MWHSQDSSLGVVQSHHLVWCVRRLCLNHQLINNKSLFFKECSSGTKGHYKTKCKIFSILISLFGLVLNVQSSRPFCVPYKYMCPHTQIYISIFYVMKINIYLYHIHKYIYSCWLWICTKTWFWASGEFGKVWILVNNESLMLFYCNKWVILI